MSHMHPKSNAAEDLPGPGLGNHTGNSPGSRGTSEQISLDGPLAFERVGNRGIASSTRHMRHMEMNAVLGLGAFQSS